jgi:hypothetical protein
MKIRFEFLNRLHRGGITFPAYAFNLNNMKRLLYLLFILAPYLTAQVGIGTTSPNALLEIESTNQATPSNTDGILIPKIDEFPASNPGAGQDGMLVYATGSGSVNKGFYYWDNGGTIWVAANGAKSINELNDGISDNDGTNNGSSIYLGVDAGANDDASDNQNVGIGYNAMRNNTTGFYNVSFGHLSLRNNTVGYSNSAMGFQSMRFNTTGYLNTAIGSTSLYRNISGYHNIAIGEASMEQNTTGYNNTAVGYRSLTSNTTGFSNTAVGSLALEANIAGISNAAFGRRAMEFKTGGNNNTAIGTLALRANTTGSINTVLGSAAGYNVEGDGNVIIGAGRTLTGTRTISNSVFIGKYAGDPETNSERLYIENSETASPLIYGEFDNDILGFNGDVGINTQSPSASLHVNHQSGAATEGLVLSNATDADEWRMYVQWNSNTLAMFFNNTNVGNFDDVSGTYTAVSDRRMKHNISPVEPVMERVKQLEVVDYNFVHQEDSRKYTGLIAQDVMELFPNLVAVPDDESENLTMDYSGFGVLAIKAIQEQQSEIDALKKDLEDLKNLIKTTHNE